jgi:hypothetical protein
MSGFADELLEETPKWDVKLHHQENCSVTPLKFKTSALQKIPLRV